MSYRVPGMFGTSRPAPGKSSEFLALEASLAQRLRGLDPRAGRGALSPPAAATAGGARRHLCIFVPSSARKRRFVEAAEVAWRVWGTKERSRAWRGWIS